MGGLSPTWHGGAARRTQDAHRGSSNYAPMARERRVFTGRLIRTFRQVRPALQLIIGGISVLILLAALLERLVEPAVFTSFGLSLWWAVVTVATVGYGDVVPVSPVGRSVAIVVMLFGMAWVPTVTTLVVTALTRSPEEDDVRHAALTQKLDEVSARLERLEQSRGGD
jgi:voltage-gated potassium channel Kch